MTNSARWLALPVPGGDSPRSVTTRVLPEDSLYLRRELILARRTLFSEVIAAAAYGGPPAQDSSRIYGRLAGDETISFAHA
jgi:hypothetical protein